MSIPFWSWFCDTEKTLECLLVCEAKNAHLIETYQLSWMDHRPFGAPHQYPSASCHISSAWKQSNHSKRHVGCLRRLSSLFLKHSSHWGFQDFCEASTYSLRKTRWFQVTQTKNISKWKPSQKEGNKKKIKTPQSSWTIALKSLIGKAEGHCLSLHLPPRGTMLLKRFGTVNPIIFFFDVSPIHPGENVARVILDPYRSWLRESGAQIEISGHFFGENYLTQKLPSRVRSCVVFVVITPTQSVWLLPNNSWQSSTNSSLTSMPIAAAARAVSR